MAIALEVRKVGQSRRHRKIIYKATPTGNYPTGGDTIDFTAATNPLSLPLAFLAFPPTVDQVGFLDSLAGNDPEYVAGTTLKNGLLKLWNSQNNEHANGVYSAGELADAVYIEVEVPIGK